MYSHSVCTHKTDRGTKHDPTPNGYKVIHELLEKYAMELKSFKGGRP
jgi:hypothetical protein